MSPVKENAYCWDPVAVRAALPADAPAITPIVLHALLDAMWLSEARVEIASPATKVRTLLGLERAEFQAAVTALIGAGLLQRLEDLGGKISWRSPLLVETRERIESLDRLAEKRAEKRAAKEAQDAIRQSMRRRVGGQAPASMPKVTYLKVAEREAEGFKGWLPTSSFDRNGQAVVVTDVDLQSIVERFPEKDVRSILGDMLQDLMRRPGMRPPANRMLPLVEKYMRGEAKPSRQSVDLDSLGDALEDLPDFD